MAPQSVETAETIAALKRALRREREAPSTQSIHAATNRGNKLLRGASHVHAGALPYPYGPEGFKQARTPDRKIEHAGFTRYILERNPKRFNEYGDELVDSESDAEADLDADDENPYAGIHLEKLLRPLTDPSELATHPTLSQPFLDPALPNMIESTELKLRQERANLWRAKNMNRLFMGDESWVPLEHVEASEDWDLFEPKPNAPSPHPNKRRKRDNVEDVVLRRVNGHDYTRTDHLNETGAEGDSNDDQVQVSGHKNQPDQDEPVQSVEPNPADEVDLLDDNHPKTNGRHADHEDDSKADESIPSAKDPNQDAMEVDGDHAEAGTMDGSPPPAPTRRITRALAAEREGEASDRGSPTLSESTLDSVLLQPDPLFLLPASMSNPQNAPRFAAQLGLPADEFLETRRLLMLYIQKQEESVRGYEALLGKLVKARRMRDQLFEWCKAEGAGEMSDGEDWVDEAFWGLAQGELRKGRDEEDQPVEEEGRKGKRRARRD